MLNGENKKETAQNRATQHREVLKNKVAQNEEILKNNAAQNQEVLQNNATQNEKVLKNNATQNEEVLQNNTALQEIDTLQKKEKNRYYTREFKTGIYRNHKDGVAYKLFSGKKESLSLYNSIMKTDYTDPDELEIVTLNSAIYIGRKNDNAVILHFNMLLTEFQTTFNPNMPLRTLIYVSNEYEKYIAEHKLNLYSEYIQKIPTPHFVTLYYGNATQPGKQILKLSDAYKCETKTPELELLVTQYNVNPNHNEELKKSCPELDGYIKYVDKTRRYHKSGMSYEEAVKKAVDECIKENILKDFFTENKAEVISMTIFEYDEEEHMRLEREEQYRKGEEIGEARGIEIGESRGEKRGEQNKLKNLIKKKLAKNKSIPQIADEVEESEEKVLELIKEMESGG